LPVDRKEPCVFYNPGNFNHRASRPQQIGVLLGLLALCLMVGGEAARFTVPNVASWYATLARPPLSPPNWLFGPVWSVLYVLMAVAAWLVWRGPAVGRLPQLALVVWGCQLAVNALWTPVFFGLRMIAPALAVILVLLGAVGLTCAIFWRVNRAAGLLFLPYLAWVAFAAYLNAGFWWLNHG
jgi:tryptophan-rich sensory protein